MNGRMWIEAKLRELPEGKIQAFEWGGSQEAQREGFRRRQTTARKSITRTAATSRSAFLVCGMYVVR